MYRIVLYVAMLTYSLGVSGQRFFSTNGKDIIDPQGFPAILKGINIGNWLVPEGYMFKLNNSASPRQINDLITEMAGSEFTKYFWKEYLANYITQKDVAFIKSLGLNSIRVPFHYKLFTDEDYLGYERGIGFDIMDSLINWCRREKIYLILDMQCAPCGQTGQSKDDSYGYPWLFEDEMCVLKTSTIWKEIARKYRNEHTIIGYEILNEPIASIYDTARLNPKLEPVYKAIVQSIREVDNNHIIFIGGSQANTNFKHFGAPFDSKLVYTFHQNRSDTTTAVIKDIIEFGNKYNVPIWLGESGPNTDQWINNFRTMLETNNIGWCIGPYKNMENSNCIVTFNKPNFYDEIINYDNESHENSAKMFMKLPPNDHVRSALTDFNNSCNFKYCIPNKGYIDALGVNKVY